MPHHDPVALRDLAADLAVRAGDRVHSMWHVRADWDSKSTPTDPVTAADRAGERLVLEQLAEQRPDDGILGEEGLGNRDGTTGLRWCIDPLDGTVNFTYGMPAWSVSIAVEDAVGAIAGAVYAPALGDLYVAARGLGAVRNGTPIAVTDVVDPALTMIGTGFYYDVDVRRIQGPEVADLVTRARDVRRVGSAALDLAMVASGQLDVFAEWGLNPWDWAAGALLVTEAGGTVSMFERIIADRPGRSVVAGGRAAHDWVLAWARARAGEPDLVVDGTA